MTAVIDDLNETSRRGLPHACAAVDRGELSAGDPQSAQRLHYKDTKPWYQKLSRKGWLCPGWPKEFGGMGLSPGKQLIFLEEKERHGCSRFNEMGMTMLGPLLIRYGTREQQDYYLPKILTGEHIWCQGYSEPNAGSDLASLRTEAMLDGDEWVVNGQKIWTSLAMDANWIFLLVRTDKQAKKQDGISFLLVPMDSPGITVRPITNIDMGDEFCETFFDNVRVPKGNMVGQINKGWTMAKNLLGFERIGSGRRGSRPMRCRGCVCWRSGWACGRRSGSRTATRGYASISRTIRRCTANLSRRSIAANRWGRTCRC